MSRRYINEIGVNPAEVWGPTPVKNEKILKEENKMQNPKCNRVVNVYLFDNSLSGKNSLVEQWEGVVTSGTNEELKMDIMMESDVKGSLEDHNSKREKIVNKEILNSTGQKVMLEPVKLSDLTWVFKD